MRNRMVSVLLVCTSLSFPCFAIAQSPSADQGRIRAETEKFEAETDKLKAERKKLEAETSSAKLAWIVGVLQIYLPFLAIVLTVILGFIQLRAQHKAQVDRANVDVILKAAEIAMNTNSASLVLARWKLLSSMLSTLEPNLCEQLRDIDLEAVGFDPTETGSRHCLRRSQVTLIKRLHITEIYDKLFHEDDKKLDDKIKDLLNHLKQQSSA